MDRHTTCGLSGILLTRIFILADEVALLLKKQIPSREFERIRQYYRDESTRVLMKSGMITESFVLLPKAVGGRYVEIRLAQDAYQADIQRQTVAEATVSAKANHYLEITRAGFALPLPDGEFDYERLDTENTYGDKTLPNLNTGHLITALEELPCCGTDVPKMRIAVIRSQCSSRRRSRRCIKLAIAKWLVIHAQNYAGKYSAGGRRDHLRR